MYLAINISSCKFKAKAPDRFNGIPESAVWTGGSDGGSWIQIIQTLSSNVYKIRIYNENTGEIEVDAPFLVDSMCHSFNIDSLKIITSLNGYDGKRIFLNFGPKKMYCSLLWDDHNK